MPSIGEHAEQQAQDKLRLKQVVEAGNFAKNSLRHDECRDWIIRGSGGVVWSINEGELQIYARFEGRARRWGYFKRALDFARVTQDGDDEGCLTVKLPLNEAQLNTIREQLRIHSTRAVSENALVALAKYREENAA